MPKQIHLAVRLASYGLGIALLLRPISTHAGTIRDDVPDSLYTALAAQPEYAAVGKITTTIPFNTVYGSGTLIGSEWVLTAAHLVSAWELGADPGSVVFNISGTDYTAMEWIPNAAFNGDLSSYPPGDLALVRLSGPVSGIAPALRFTGASEIGSTATIVGYGTTGTGLTGYQDNTYGTKRAGQNVLDALGSSINLAGVTLADDYVLADFDRPGVPSESSLGSATPLALEYSSASGDSGGGVFVSVSGQARLAGVVAFGYQVFDTYTNADYGDGMGFTRVNQFNGWIDDQLSAIYWSNGVSGSLANGANWINGAAPGAGNVAVFKVPGTYSVTFAGATSNKRIRVLTGAVTFDLAGQNYTLGNTSQEPSILVAKLDADDAALTLTNGTVSAVDVVVAQSGVSIGRLMVSGAGTHLNLSGSATVGSGVSSSSSGIGLLKVDGGASVSIAGRLKIGFTGTVDALAGTISLAAFDLSGKLAVAGPFTISADSTWTSGAMSGTGVTTIPAGRMLTISSSNTYSKILDGRTLENAGTVVWSGSGSIYSAGTNATINNLSGGLFEIRNNDFLSPLSGSGQTFNNAGTLRKSAGTGSTSVQWAFNNTGAVEIQTGRLDLQQGGTESGAFNIASGTSLGFSGGTFQLNVGTSFSNAGNVSISGGTVNVNTSLTLSGGWTWSGGTISGSSTVRIPVGGSLPLTSNSSKTLSGAVIENAGTVTWSGTGSISGIGTGATINNLAGGLVEIQNDRFLDAPSGSGQTFNNGGTVRKSAGTGSTTFNWAFNNTGTVEVQAGTLALQNGGTASGVFDIASGASLNFFVGIYQLNAGTSFTNAGSVSINAVGSGVTVNVNAPLNLSGGWSLTSNNGKLAGTGTATFDNLTWSGGTMSGTGITRIGTGGALLVNTFASKFIDSRTLENQGTATWMDGGGILALGTAATFNNQAGGIFEIQNNASLGISSGSGHVFNNAGLVRKSSGTGTTGVSWGFSNTGTVEVLSGTLSLSGSIAQLAGSTLTGGTWKVFANSALSMSGSNITTNQADVLLSGSGSTFAQLNSLTNNQGSFTVSDGRAFTTAGALSNSGTLRVSAGGTLTVTSTYTQTGGVTRLDDGVLASSSPLSLQAGLLAGSGTVNASISSSGTLAPGNSPGALTVNGSLSLLANSELRMEIGGLFQGTQYDYVDVNGMVSLGGQLVLSFLNGFESMVSGSSIFTLLTADAPLTGAFSDVANGARLATADGLGSFVVNYGAGSAYGANNLVLTSAIPEPSTLAMLLGGGSALGLFRRRSRRFLGSQRPGASSKR